MRRCRPWSWRRFLEKMRMWLRLAFALTMLVVPTGISGATFPCTMAGIDDAVQMGGGPPVLDCTTADTITVPGPGGLSIARDLHLDFGGVTIEFESIARGRLYIAPTVDCTPDCVRGSTSVRLGNFTLRGGVTVSTSPAFSAPGPDKLLLQPRAQGVRQIGALFPAMTSGFARKCPGSGF